MARIEEVFDDVKDVIGDKGFIIAICAFVVLFVISFLKQSKESDVEYVAPTAYASYPDAVTNANVIIDTLQNSIDYSEDELKGYMNENFVATNDYIKEGFEASKELSEKLHDESMSAMGEISGNIEGVSQQVNGVSEQVKKVQSTSNKILSNTSTIISQNNSILDNNNSMSGNIDKLLSGQKNSGLVMYMTPTNTSVGTTSTGTKTMSTNYTGVSIVDGLKAGGYNSAYSYREQLAKANGISNYRGTAQQNTQMLNMLKAGTLKAV